MFFENMRMFLVKHADVLCGRRPCSGLCPVFFCFPVACVFLFCFCVCPVFCFVVLCVEDFFLFCCCKFFIVCIYVFFSCLCVVCVCCCGISCKKSCPRIWLVTEKGLPLHSQSGERRLARGELGSPVGVRERTVAATPVGF